MVPQSSGLKARYSWSFQPESIPEFSWCLGGQTVVENPNKQRKMCGVPLCQAIWSCSFLCMYQGKWEVTEKWNWSGYSEDYDSCFGLYCSVHLRVGIKHSTSVWKILESVQSTKTVDAPNKL